MNPFIFENPTRLIFGEGQLKELPKQLAPYGKKVLLLYGGGSIKKNGIYDQVKGKLAEVDAIVTDFPDIESNPRISTVRRGVEICKQEGIDFLLAVGGGSVIDCTKAIAVGAKTEADMWDVITRKASYDGALPFGSILTHAATGSEMNRGCVITNWELHEKRGWGCPYTYGQFSILDPAFTTTVPRKQTALGIIDIMSHVMEHYFHLEKNTPIQDQWCESLLRTLIDVAPKLLDDLGNVQHRETVMLGGALALSDILNMGYRGDWGSHQLGHALSAVHDVSHGDSLAVVFPNWLAYVLSSETIGRLKQFAENVFAIDGKGKSDRQIAEAGIQALRQFWTDLGAPATLSDLSINAADIQTLAENTVQFTAEFGNFKKLSREDAHKIFEMSL
ncbi:iron-containing alcohol dehydrogenase [Ornithinibacillus gellani]|uniref:iron-containing alcohol dehydrogenase n=1 Tax=Ornithinibacillus gellani TaxID=2293253 RepID=UPI000F47A4FD|nr:iron-containing alcohol dehydrogenase [Ornithinibacillus gellani]TQS72049.1 iron-containing alcohol dehydrogenase [Ornithinibacillus gellani]